MSMKLWWMILTGENLSTRRKTCPTTTLFTTNPTLTGTWDGTCLCAVTGWWLLELWHSHIISGDICVLCEVRTELLYIMQANVCYVRVNQWQMMDTVHYFTLWPLWLVLRFISECNSSLYSLLVCNVTVTFFRLDIKSNAVLCRCGGESLLLESGSVQRRNYWLRRLRQERRSFAGRCMYLVQHPELWPHFALRGLVGVLYFIQSKDVARHDVCVNLQWLWLG